MLSISFQGWAQCRLATDPDPYDEPRGVSGYMQAYVGEPDFDRIIRFRDPQVLRTYTPDIDVRVSEVRIDGTEQAGHPLLSAKVDLLEDPVFEGRNGAVSEDGYEPVFPFHIKFGNDEGWFSRAVVPSNPTNPYREFNATGVNVDPGKIQRATGMASLIPVWEDRLKNLKKDANTASDEDRPGILERIEFLERNIASGGGAGRFFVAYMEWDYLLKSAIEQSPDGLNTLLSGFDASEDPWRVSFWFGGWDADAAAYWVQGVLDIAETSEKFAIASNVRPERMSDIDV